MMQINPVRTAAQSNPVRFGAAQTKVTGANDRFVSVSSVGSVSKVPDVMSMTLSFSATSETKDGKGKKKAHADVLKALETRSASIKKAISNLNLPLKLTGGPSVDEWHEYNRQTGEHENKGFRGHYALTVTAEKKSLSELKDLAAKLTEIAFDNELQFSKPQWDYSNRKSATAEAIHNAVASMKDQLAEAAKAFGIKISDTPVDISIGSPVQSGGRHAMRAMAAMEAPEAAPMGGMSADAFDTENVKIASPQINAVFALADAAPASKAKKKS